MNSLSRRRTLKTLFCSSAALALNLQNRSAQAEVSKNGLHFLAIGDFGTGAADQKAVAKAMQDFAKNNSLKPEAMFMIGDNFYGPTKDGFTTESKRWKLEIEEMYPAASFPGPMYSVLGNHDYHDNAGGQEVQLAYSKKANVRWKMPNKWYRQDFGGLLTLICLDSNLPAVSGAKDKKNRQTTCLTHLSRGGCTAGMVESGAGQAKSSLHARDGPSSPLFQWRSW